MQSDQNSYESSLARLARNYGNYYDDKNSRFGADIWNHLIDPDTYEILKVMKKKDQELPDGYNEWQGRTCYEFFEKKDAPCEDCLLKDVRRDNIHVCIKNISQSGKRFFFESTLVDYNGKPAVYQKLIDITDPKYKDFVMDEYLRIRNLSSRVLSTLMEESHIMDNFERACKEMCLFFDADRALITEYCSGKLNAEWSRLEQPFTQVCTELSDEGIANITREVELLNYIWIPDVPNADKLDKNLRDYWSSRGINSLLLIPMRYNGSFIGTVSLHNMRSHFNAIDSMKLIGMAVAKNIHAYVMESKAEKQLYTEPLTGALNLGGLKRKANELLRRYPDNKYYFCMMDIRYFGGINRRYGFELGDKILIKVAENLEKYMDEDEAFCRISADVFCFLAKFPGEEAVERRFRRFAETMQCFDVLKAADFVIEFQCGAYVLNGDRDIAQAIDKANLARLSLRDERGSNVAFFSNALLEKSKHETELLQDFRPALAHGELTVFYQPQCNYSTQNIVGSEALVRWRSPKHGNVSPADFIPLLERNGLIYELDKFVWEEVCKHQRKWMDMGCACPVSVNLSRHDILSNDICEVLCSLLDKYGIPKELIPLEITETAYIKDSEEIIRAVDNLKSAGFTVEMDDFGSGYSSLNALKDISVDLLKLDMKFLDMGSQTGKGGSILSCVVRMTRWLDIRVLAEGVETKEQAEYLKNIGCDLMQGYYFAKPMPDDEFEKLLLTKGIEKKHSADNDDVRYDKFVDALMTHPLLFNSIGAAMIVEISGSSSEAIMANDSFYDLIGMTREEYLPYMKNIRSYADKAVADPAVLDSFKSSANGTRRRSCMMNCGGVMKKVRIYSRTLLEEDDRMIILLCLDDISELSVNA